MENIINETIKGFMETTESLIKYKNILKSLINFLKN